MIKKTEKPRSHCLRTCDSQADHHRAVRPALLDRFCADFVDNPVCLYGVHENDDVVVLFGTQSPRFLDNHVGCVKAVGGMTTSRRPHRWASLDPVDPKCPRALTIQVPTDHIPMPVAKPQPGGDESADLISIRKAHLGSRPHGFEKER